MWWRWRRVGRKARAGREKCTSTGEKNRASGRACTGPNWCCVTADEGHDSSMDGVDGVPTLTVNTRSRVLSNSCSKPCFYQLAVTDS